MVYKYALANVGPPKMYHFLKEHVGGYENIGCTQKDLQNYRRDLKALIKDTDVHMFIDVLKNKKEVVFLCSNLCLDLVSCSIVLKFGICN